METYSNYISQFEIFENPPKKKGFHRHHIVSKCEQMRIHGSITDQRQIYVTPVQHLWCHILYDRDNDTNTSLFLLNQVRAKKEDIDSLEKCFTYIDTFNKNYKKQCQSQSGKNNPMCKHGLSNEHEKALRDAWRGQHHTEEWKMNQSQSMIGNSIAKGRKWFNNGEREVMAFECPEGFVPGLLPQHKTTKNKGKHLYNNGKITVLRESCPEGFVPGRLRKVQESAVL